MDIQSLPELVINTLVEYLTEDDVLHCSMVSSSWREAFNNDRYWKKFCLRRHRHSLYDYLGNPCWIGFETLTFLEPVRLFKFSVESSMLPALCKWKVDYMRARHLERNIDHGNYRIYKMRLSSKYTNQDYVVKGSNGDMICLYNVRGGWCELWNICGLPCLQTKLKLALAGVRNITLSCTLTMNQQILVILQGNVLQIFHSSARDFILKYNVLLDKRDGESLGLLKNKEVGKAFDNLKYVRYEDNIHFSCGKVYGNVYIAIYTGGHFNFTLCLWNLETGRKDKQIYLGDIPFPYPSDPTIELHGSNTVIVVVGVRHYGEHHLQCSAIFKYNIESGEKMCSSHIENILCVIDEDLVIAKHNESLQFYGINTENATLLKTITDLVFDTYYVHAPYLMLSKSTLHSMNTIATITVIHTKTYDVLCTFNAEFKDPISDVTFDQCNDCILIIRCDLSLEVWNWKKQLKLYTLTVPYEWRVSPLQINAHFTHMYKPVINRPLNCPKGYFESFYIYYFW